MPTWHGVLVMRALIGLCLSGLVAVAMTYISEEIHPQVLGFTMGLYIAGNAIGGNLTIGDADVNPEFVQANGNNQIADGAQVRAEGHLVRDRDGEALQADVGDGCA